MQVRRSSYRKAVLVAVMSGTQDFVRALRIGSPFWRAARGHSSRHRGRDHTSVMSSRATITRRRKEHEKTE